jgi:uncharacterized DUF497 family protein
MADGVRLYGVFVVRPLLFKERWFTLGMASEGRLLAVSHTYRPTGPGSAQVRIISAREAMRREREQYENEPR